MEQTKWLLLADVARILDCRPHQVVYLLTSRQIQEPGLRIGGRRIFTPADVERIKQKLNKKGQKI